METEKVKCDECHTDSVPLYPYWEWLLCSECLRIMRENDRINQEDSIKEDRLLK